jgi:TRAP-type mannitol/chloroaromatic compound transport system substrate-binding protein
MYVGLEETADLIARSSGGRLVWQIYPAGALVEATKEFDGVHGGILEAGTGAASYWRDKFLAAGLFTFTVAGLSPMESLYWFETGGGKELLHRMIAGYDVQCFSGEITPPEIFLQSTKPLDTLDDIKGLKIRTAGDDGEIFDRMGASAIFLPAGEIYESLQRGVIDAAQLSTPALDWSFGMQEVADYLYLSGVRQPADWTLFFVKKSEFEALPDDLKRIVEAEMAALTPRFYAWLMTEDIKAMENFIAYGTNIAPASREIVDELARQARIFYEEKAAEDVFFAEVINSIWDFQDLYRATWERL